MRKILVLILFSTKLWAYDPMYPNYSKTIGPDVFNLLLDYDYFSTSANFDGNGNKVPLPEGDSFSKNDLNLNIKYGLLKHFDLGFGFRFRINDSVQDTVNKTTLGFESFSLGVKWNFLPRGVFNLALDFNLGWTFYKNSQAQIDSNQLILGDPGTALGINLLAGYGFLKILGLNGMVGWHLPPNDLSQEILYNLMLNIRFSYYLIEVGFGGKVSLKTDLFESYEQKLASHGFNTGGSNLFYSFHQEVFTPFASISALLWDTTRIQFRVAQNVTGSSTDEGTTFGANILFNFGSGTTKVVKKERPPTDLNTFGKIIGLSPENKFAKLNIGTSKGVSKGMKVFFYRKTKIEDVVLAKGYIKDVGVNWSVVEIEKYFRDENIKIGQIIKIKVE